MICANSAENIKTTTSGHLQIQDQRIRCHFLNAAYGLQHIARLSYKLRTGYLLQQIRQTFHNYPRVIGDKDLHLLLLKSDLPK